MLELSRHSNQARGIGQYAIDMLRGNHAGPSDAVLDRTEAFFRDSMACGASALFHRANAPAVLWEEARSFADASGSTSSRARA